MDFQQAFDLLINNEGGYQCAYNDSGNWTGGKAGAGILKGTKFGISAAAYPKLDIKYLTKEQVKPLYLQDYWVPVSADQMPACVRFDLFDTAVHSGVSAATVILQRALSVKPDGVIGPITLSAAANAGNNLDKRFNGYRLKFIAQLSSDKWQSFGRGMVNRIAENLIKD